LADPAVRARMSAASKKALADPAVRARMSAALKGRKRSDETRRKMAERCRAWWKQRREASA
jgi:hypothetical protein